MVSDKLHIEKMQERLGKTTAAKCEWTNLMVRMMIVIVVTTVITDI
jgi:hypothetical protein